MEKLTSEQEDFILEQAREKDYEHKEAYALMLIDEEEVITDD
jgi:hypothetical protein